MYIIIIILLLLLFYRNSFSFRTDFSERRASFPQINIIGQSIFEKLVDQSYLHS